MHQGKPFEIYAFTDPSNPLLKLPQSAQQQYLVTYLSAAGAVSILVEPNYFDRDYLDEFAAFYSKSAKGYLNICSRLHFFKSEFTKNLLDDSLGRLENSHLQNDYLGFIVLRPLSSAPFGRTVLSWYANHDQNSTRITPALREYTSNVVGISLKTLGIPWQQQDTGVSACATIALWSMFHSAAFDANHSIPTTVEITQNALEASAGSRAFPSRGLTYPQICEAIFAQRLSPKILGFDTGFPVKLLASLCAANIRSGYPVLLIGRYVHEPAEVGHAICCIGFREREQEDSAPGSCITMDDQTDIFYIHDDNIGPNVRCRLVEKDGFAVLRTEPPDYIPIDQRRPQPAFEFMPDSMIIAVHEEIRMDALSLVRVAEQVANYLTNQLNRAYQSAGEEQVAISFMAQFLDVRKFFSSHLPLAVNENPVLLSQIRLDLGQNAPPLCLHIGLVSIGKASRNPARYIDIIYDTTDSAMKCQAIAHVVYSEGLKRLLDQCNPEVLKELGYQVIAY